MNDRDSMIASPHQVRRSGATAAAGGDTATSLPVSANRDAPHYTICICDQELLEAGVVDMRCPTHGLSAGLTAAVRSIKAVDRG